VVDLMSARASRDWEWLLTRRNPYDGVVWHEARSMILIAEQTANLAKPCSREASNLRSR